MPEMRVDLSANSAQFAATMATVRKDLAKTGESFGRIGGVAGEAGEQLTKGLKRSVGEFAQLGNAAGLAGGAIGKVGASMAHLASTGFSPLSLAIAAVGFTIGSLVERQREAQRAQEEFTASVMEGRKEIEKQREAFAGLIGDATEYKIRALRIAAEEAMLLADQSDNKDTFGGPREKARQAQEALNIALRTVAVEKAKAEVAARTKAIQADEAKRIRANNEAVSESVRKYNEFHAAIEKVKKADEAAEIKKITDANADLLDTMSQEAQWRREEAAEWAQRRRDKQEEVEILKRRAEILGRMAEAERDASGYNPGYSATLKDESQRIEVRNFTTELAAMREEMIRTDEIGVALAQTLTHGVAGSMADAFMEAASGAKDLKSAIGDMAKAIVADLTRMVIEALIFQAIMGALTGGSSVAAGAAANTARNSGEFGAIDNFHPSAKSMKVDVHNYNGSSVSVAEGMDADGTKRLEVFVEEAAAKSVARGGKLWHAMQSASGASRQPRRRG